MKNLKSILFASAILLPLASCGDDGGDGTLTADAARPAIDAEVGGGPDAMEAAIDVDANIAGRLVDRAGRPGISTVLLGCSICGTLSDSEQERNDNRTAFSTMTPALAAANSTLTDAQNEAIDGLAGVGANPVVQLGLDQATLKAVLVAGFDMLQIDPSGNSAGYLSLELGTASAFGGRALGDDVVDASLNVLTQGAIASDAIDKGARTFRTTFPYVGAPWPAP